MSQRQCAQRPARPSIYLVILPLLWPATVWTAEAPGQKAEARDGGIAINASGNAKVEIHQTLEQYDPEVAKLLKRMLKESKGMQKELSELRRDSQALRKQLLDEQAGGIDDVLRKARSPNPSATALTAKRDLERGDTSSAEALLGEGEREALTKQPPDLRRAAELARQAGALATYRDTKTALAAYQRAASYEPDNPDNWWMLGNLLMDSLRRPEATQAYRRLIEVASERVRNEPTNSKWRTMLGVGYRNVATALLAQDNVTEAAPLAAQSLTLAEQWPADQLETREAQDALILGQMLIARVRLDEGDLVRKTGTSDPAALLDAVRSKAETSLSVYEQALAHINELLDRNVDDDDLWLKHSDCHEGMGWAMALASHGGARGEFLKSAATLKRIVQRNPESDFYRDRLASSYQALGGYMATIEKNPTAALDVYRKGLTVRQQLAEQNPSNPRWQLDLVHAYQSTASLAQVWASVPSLLDTNYRDHMKPPPIKSPEAISFLRNAQRILRQLDEQGLLLAREQRLDRQIEAEILDLECQQKGFESNFGGQCMRPLPARMMSR